MKARVAKEEGLLDKKERVVCQKSGDWDGEEAEAEAEQKMNSA